jgi:hypothetical protein
MLQLNRQRTVQATVAAAAILVFGCSAAQAEDPIEDVRPMVDKGLRWLADHQSSDGSWPDDVPVRCHTELVALAGLAFLADGNSLADGRYSHHLWKALRAFEKQAQPSGLLCDPRHGDGGWQMVGHAHALLFLSQVYAIDQNESRREELHQLLDRAVAYSARAQTTRGGWGYVEARDGGDFDEDMPTQWQLQALHAAHRAGIAVPDEVFDKARTYLRKANIVFLTRDDPLQSQAGLVFTLYNGLSKHPEPLSTTAALATNLRAGDRDAVKLAQWLNFSQATMPIGLKDRRKFTNAVSYEHYWLALVAHSLAEDGHARLRPDLADQEKSSRKELLLTWSRFRRETFRRFAEEQHNDGSWQTGMNPTTDTALRLIVLQLECEHVSWLGR